MNQANLNRSPAEPLHVVLVEDSSADAALTRAQLEETAPGGLNVTPVALLSEAQERIGRIGADCVLLDLSLPDADGLEGVEVLCSDFPALPVVVLSANDDEPTALMAVRHGAEDYLVKSRVTGDAIARAVRHAVERRAMRAQLAHQALHDPLTDLPNRSLFADRLEQTLARCQRSAGLAAVMFVDLDRFKAVNDSLGHEAGDRALTEIADRLSGAIRPDDTVARFGGDEFIVLCEVDSELHAAAIGERLAAAVSREFQLAGHRIGLSVSIGIAFSRGVETSPAALVRDADAAMYRAKERGGAGIEIFRPGMRRDAVERLDLESELRHAIERRQLELHWQPIIDLQSRTVVAAEALVRWRHPLQGLLAPDTFIPLAEETGLIAELGVWVMEAACHQSTAWRENGVVGSQFLACVNISARELEDGSALEQVSAALDAAGYSPERLCLEISERTPPERSPTTLSTLNGLSDLGVRLALDDFGIGQSSLDMLRRLPIHWLKLDRSFVARLYADPRTAAVTSGIASLAHALGATVVAEGIESESQRNRLLELGSDLGQGFAIARPAPAAQMPAAFERAKSP